MSDAIQMDQCLRDRISGFNVPQRAKDFVLSIPLEADLRVMDIPGVAKGTPTHHALLALLLESHDWSFWLPFTNCVPAGPLGSMQVYTTDAQGIYAGKAHAPGHCQHAERIGAQADLLTFADWLPVLKQDSDSAKHMYTQSRLCSKCGGFAVRRISSPGRLYLDAARQVWSRAQDVERLERARAGVTWQTEPVNESQWDASLQTLDHITLELAAVAAAEDGLREYCQGLADRVEVQRRRISIRVNNR